MKSKLFDYIERDNFIFNLSGVTKLLCFFFLSFAVMFSYDIRSVIVITIFSFVMLGVSQIKFKQIKVMLYYVFVFLILNFILTFIFSPQYGTEIYGTSHELFHIAGRYIVTQEQLLYQVTKVMKYASVIPLGMLFLLTTNPSEFAASLSGIHCNYKAAFALSLTLRYFPDMIRDYNDIALAQQSRGLDLSKKEKLGIRIKNIMNIFIPLIFSTLERIDVISNAMDLRGFGKHKKRTWYVKKKLRTSDYVCVIVCGLIFLATILISIFVNHGRFWNPFVYGLF
ncbi:MAG: energy-coupling factor transporter transmembrane component T [Lachnospiraceae bacterium]